MLSKSSSAIIDGHQPRSINKIALPCNHFTTGSPLPWLNLLTSSPLVGFFQVSPPLVGFFKVTPPLVGFFKVSPPLAVTSQVSPPLAGGD